ncbi:MAG: glutathione S-transferase, partial [Sulfitobacter sp.]|nr:glutathione S-transferase [Sulfitobacter sp.]
MNSYILHYAPDNASLIIRLALEALGQPYRTVLVDRAASAQTSPAYLALNPHGLIPVLECPDGAIFETGAILLWLTDRHGELGPKVHSPKRADFLKWLFFISNTVHPALRMTFYPEKYAGADARHQAALRSTMQAALSR